MGSDLSRSELALFDALDTIAWGGKHFGSLCTGRLFPRRRMLGLVRRGLVESCGMVALCDDDGCLVDPERLREGFKLTTAGIATLRDLDARRSEVPDAS